jgi:hypothetical protein
LTIHQVDAEFRRHNFVLAAIPFDNISHTGENLSQKITDTLSQNQFDVDKIFALTRDDAKNMQKCGRLLNVYELFKNILIEIILIFCSFQCSAHYIHLVVTDAFKNVQLSKMSLMSRQNRLFDN